MTMATVKELIVMQHSIKWHLFMNISKFKIHFEATSMRNDFTSFAGHNKKFYIHDQVKKILHIA